MSELLLQTIIEKLEALEIALLKESNAGKDETAAQSLLKEATLLQPELIKHAFRLKVSDERMSKLLEQMGALNSTLDNPVVKKVNHSHHLHKGTWITVGLFLVSLFLLFGWINTSNTKEEFKANDIKYRYLKVNGNASLVKLLYHTDSLYNQKNVVFIKQVIQHEQHLAEQAELLRLAGEKEKEASELKKKAKQ